MAADSAGPDYAGDITVEQAYEMLTNNGNTVLVDVRTQAEWALVGMPDLSSLGKETVFVSWQVYPTMELNHEFARQLADQGVNQDNTVLFLCRSGQRSKSAAIAMTAAGFRECFNVAGGFEGPVDPRGHRGTIDGWKAKNLPWLQR